MQRKSTRNNDKWVIRLGEDYALRFTQARPNDPTLRLLGSVTRGAQVGALASCSDGTFVQLNGDHLTPLSRGQVQRAVNKAQSALVDAQPIQRRPRIGDARPGNSQSTPVVTIKRRRILSGPPGS